MTNKELLNLVINIQNGDMDSFDILYKNTKKHVFLVAYTIFKNEEICNDIMQETYLDFLKKIKRIKNNVDIIGLLVLSAKNKAINLYNRNKKENEIILKSNIETYSNDYRLDTPLLNEIKTTLKDTEYKIFILHVLGEYTFKEISKFLDIPVGTLTWSYQEARKKLINKLKGIYIDERN